MSLHDYAAPDRGIHAPVLSASGSVGWWVAQAPCDQGVPVIPFLFLLAATLIVRLPAVLAVPIGILATYWS
jgi:hypothetical protein